MNAPLEANTLYDIYDIMYTPWYKQWWFVAVIMVATFLLVYFCIRLFFNKKPVQKKYDVYERALQRVAFLEKNSESDAHVFYTLVVHDIKKYLHERYDVAILSATDDEVVDCLEKSLVNKEIIEMVKKLFKGVVFIKFAHYSAEKDQKMQAIHYMRDIIAQGKLASQSADVTNTRQNV